MLSNAICSKIWNTELLQSNLKFYQRWTPQIDLKKTKYIYCTVFCVGIRYPVLTPLYGIQSEWSVGVSK